MARATAIVLLALPHWAWPVHGTVVRDFRLAPERYGAGGHRGIDIAAAPGTPVRAACRGRVRFAGAVPGSGRVVSEACGGLVATYLHLGATEVRRGERLRKGERLGRAGAARHVHLGARRGNTYVNPLELLSDAGAPVAPPPVPVSPPRFRGPPLRPMPPSSAPRAAPSLPWLGAGLLALAVPGLGIRRLARHRRRARARAVAQ